MARVMAQNNMKGRMNRSELDRDEELSFFRDLRKRGQNEHIPSLLLCASEEYESYPNGGSGKFSLYRIASGRKENGHEFLETNKSDFNWLKTPPATPLFPSLEMEPSPQLVTQKELPISQPISEVQITKSDMEAQNPKSTDGKANNTNSPKTSKLAKRSTIPSPLKNTTNAHISINAKKQHDASNNPKYSTPNALNSKKNIEANESHRKPRTTTRGVSPSIELSNETPPNLRIDTRSSSSTRGRSTTRAFQNLDPTPKACRPSRSPSPSMSNIGNWNQLDKAQKNLRTHKETFTLASGTSESRSHFKGSKMVEKVVNARKSSMIQGDRTKTKTSQI